LGASTCVPFEKKGRQSGKRDDVGITGGHGLRGLERLETMEMPDRRARSFLSLVRSAGRRGLRREGGYKLTNDYTSQVKSLPRGED